jgi:hypothetical protein
VNSNRRLPFQVEQAPAEQLLQRQAHDRLLGRHLQLGPRPSQPVTRLTGNNVNVPIVGQRGGSYGQAKPSVGIRMAMAQHLAPKPDNASWIGLFISQEGHVSTGDRLSLGVHNAAGERQIRRRGRGLLRFVGRTGYVCGGPPD